MLGLVQTNGFFFDRRAEQVHLLHQEEEGAEESADPRGDGEDADDLAGEKLAVTAVKDTGGIDAENFGNVGSLSHETDPEDAKGTAEAVHRGSFERIVDLKLEQELGSAVNDARAEHTADESGPRFSSGATGGDGNETSEGTVAHGNQVPDVVQVVVDDHGHETTASGSQGGGDGSAGDDARAGDDAELRTRVEAVPADPENKGAENNERGGVTRHRVDATVRSESAGARTDDPGAHQAGDTASHVHNARTGEIEHAAAKKLGAVFAPRAEPAFSGPAPVNDSWVDKGGEEEGVAEVGFKLGALGDRARDDRRGGGGERPLEKVHADIVSALDSLHGKVARAQERVRLGAVGRAKGETVAKEKPGERADARVEHIFNQNVLRVLRTHRTGAKHGETGLHEEDQVRARQQKVGVVVAVDLFELGAERLCRCEETSVSLIHTKCTYKKGKNASLSIEMTSSSVDVRERAITSHPRRPPHPRDRATARAQRRELKCKKCINQFRSRASRSSRGGGRARWTNDQFESARHFFRVSHSREYVPSAPERPKSSQPMMRVVVVVKVKFFIQSVRFSASIRSESGRRRSWSTRREVPQTQTASALFG